MADWKPITDEPPIDAEVMLWLGGAAGELNPVGCLVGKYIVTDEFVGWIEKSATGNINCGLNQDLVTHWRELDDSPES